MTLVFKIPASLVCGPLQTATGLYVSPNVDLNTTHQVGQHGLLQTKL